MDLATLQRKDVQSSMKNTSAGLIAGNMWQNYNRVISQITIFFEVANRVYFLFNFFSHQENGWQLGIVCVLSPVLNLASFWTDLEGGRSCLQSIHQSYAFCLTF
jgi:hypothetical protein